MKKIILITFISFWISSALAKVEKTTLGIDIDIPNDYVLVKKENYEQLKKIVEFSTSSQSNILKPLRDNNRSDVDHLMATGTRDKSMLVVVPMPPQKLQLHNIIIVNIGGTYVEKSIVAEYKLDLKKFCDDMFEEAKSVSTSFKNLKISECVVEKNKFKNTNYVVKIGYNTTLATELKNVTVKQYVFDIKGNGFVVLVICDKSCSRQNEVLNQIINSIK
jgi:phage pi2 protein 07